MSQNASQFQPEASSTACKNCHSMMPVGLRFCRNCGYRLGEGVQEYVETVRFPPGSGAAAPGFGMGAGPMTHVASAPVARKKSRMSGMTWIFLAMIVFFLTAGVITQFIRPARHMPIFAGQPPAPPAAPPTTCAGTSGSAPARAAAPRTRSCPAASRPRTRR